MPLFKKKKPSSQIKRTCFIYYQFFNSLLHREATTLINHGFDVDILCLRSSKKEKIIQYIDGMRILCLQTRESAEKNTINYFIRLALFFVKILGVITVLQLIRRYRVIHVTTPPDFMVFAALVPKLGGAKILMDIHDIGPELYMRKLHIPEEKRIIRFVKYIEKISTTFADHVIIVTDLWKEKVVSRSIPRTKCTTLLNVPDDKLFFPQPLKNKRTKETFDLYYHGSLEEHFGVDTMLYAMNEIKRNIPHCILTIYCGKKGRVLNEMMALRKKLKMVEYVFFNEYVSFYKLPELLTNADIGMVPTKDGVFSDEAVSMKSFEYLFSEIPIVISRTKAHRYYYTEDMVKFFTPGNSIDLANAVIELFNNPDKRKRMVQNSMQFIQKYGWHQSKQIYLNTIDNLLH